MELAFGSGRRVIIIHHIPPVPVLLCGDHRLPDLTIFSILCVDHRLPDLIVALFGVDRQVPDLVFALFCVIR